MKHYYNNGLYNYIIIKKIFLTEIYKNEFKTLSDNRYSQIAKELNLSKDIVQNIIVWIDICFQYIKLQQEIDAAKDRFAKDFVGDKIVKKALLRVEDLPILYGR